jgi:tRNA pseudouridine55 synthase
MELTQSRPRRRDREVDGILLLDKGLGVSSNDALQKARRLFAAEKAGHAGSLDPLASGMLIACFGQATKVCGRLLDAPKTYQVRVLLGQSTPSGDGETAVDREAPVPPLTDESVDRVLATFLGEQTQIPPMHSALKHEGQRLYELARRGESIERTPRTIQITRIIRGGYADKILDFEVDCSKGTYIRTLGQDIAERLGTIGYVVGLRRLSIAAFSSGSMYSLEQLTQRAAAGVESLDQCLLPTDVAFADLNQVNLDDRGRSQLLLGQAARPSGPILVGSLRAYGPQGEFLGLVEGLPDGAVQPRRLFVTVESGSR